MVLGGLLAQIITFISTLVITRIYSPVEYASYALVVSIASILAPLLSLSMENFIVPSDSDLKARNIFYHGIYLVSRHSFYAVCIGLTYFLVNRIFHITIFLAPIHTFAIILLAVSTSVLSLTLQYVLRKSSFTTLALRGPFQNLILGGSQIGLYGFGFGSFGLIVGEILGRMAGTVFMLRQIPKEAYERFSNKIYRSSGLKTGAVTVNFSTIFVEMIISSFLIIYIARTFGNSFSGQFALAQKILSLPIVLIGSVVSQVVLSKSSYALRQGQILSKKLLGKLIGILISIGSVLSLTIFYSAPSILPLLAGDDWKIAGEILKVTAPLLLITFVWNSTSSIFYVRSLWSQFFVITITRFLALIIGAFASLSLNFDLLSSIFTITAFGCLVQIGGITMLYLTSPQNNSNI